MIHGSQTCKIRYGTTNLVLNNCRFNPSYNINEEIEHRSIVTGVKKWIDRPNSAEFEVIIFLAKYADPGAFVIALMSWRNKIVMFYPHEDYNYPGVGGYCEAGIISIEFYTLENKNDMCVIRFASRNKLEKLLAKEDDGSPYIITEEGDFIIEE